jgi:predicted Rossmann fold flavoprotein
MIYDVIVIGGGPAGLMASNILQLNHINYLLLEKNEKLGKKLLISGGKRCNVTNNLSVDDFITSLTFKHKRFLYAALFDFGPKEIIQFFKDKGLTLVLEDQLKYFPETQKSSSVLEALVSAIDPNRIHYGSSVKDIKKTDLGFELITTHHLYQTKRVIVATGSSSYPSTGSHGDGLLFAKKFDIEFVNFTPAETHVYSKYVTEKLSDLQGVSLNTEVKINNTKVSAKGGLLFTHFGLSGPAILHTSEDIYKEVVKGKASISFSLTEIGKDQVLQLFQQGKEQNIHILKLLEEMTTKRLAKKILDLASIENKRIQEISKKDMQIIEDLLLNFTIEIDRVESVDKAFVNAGGILTSELNPKTMESKKVNGLYFIGETVDLHGPIGGYNITIALSTGYKCATSIHIEMENEK